MIHKISNAGYRRDSMYTNEDEDNDNDEGMKMYMSRLSIESFDGDADEEFSDEKEFTGSPELSSDSDKEPGCYSLPATPPRRRARRGSVK
ncbi:Fold protein [Melia azedarach]|uniref:Fold protein n=1 Tax=Melia azedarach TaxID=155640 RepID=A0ACC1YWX2_MELAZ|nr:Fold protein [Melia azedarach]